MQTFDSQTYDATGAFLIGELERLDPTLYMPLVSVTWNRDIDLREDVTLADEASSFTNAVLAAMGTPNPTGKNWIAGQSNAISGISLDVNKTTQNMHLWGMELGWTLAELAKAQKLSRPIDSQKHDALQLKHNMDVDEQVYIGDEVKGSVGLVNNPAITPVALSSEWTEATTAKQKLADINAILHEAWVRSGYTVCPSDLRLPPEKYGMLTDPIGEAGTESILSYVSRKCLSNEINGRPLNVQPLKWLNERGAAGKDRAMAYSKNKRYVRFPMVPLQRTPVEHRGIYQLCTYFGTLGEVEFVYPETVSYADGL
jgi:hypothetical protein